jgi:hypothetical protein
MIHTIWIQVIAWDWIRMIRKHPNIQLILCLCRLIAQCKMFSLHFLLIAIWASVGAEQIYFVWGGGAIPA